jgi:hypothetical protein
MTPVEPTAVHAGGRLVVFAKDQPQYLPLPASVDATGVVMTEWEPTAEELARLMDGGRVRIWLYTFNRPLQPIQVEVAEPTCGFGEKDPN